MGHQWNDKKGNRNSWKETFFQKKRTSLWSLEHRHCQTSLFITVLSPMISPFKVVFSICTTCFGIKETLHFAHTMYLWVWFSEWTEIIPLSSFNQSVFLIETVYLLWHVNWTDFRKYYSHDFHASEHHCFSSVMLQIFDRGGEGKVSQADTSKALYHTLAVPPEEAQRVFRQIDTTGRGYITFSKYESRCIFFFWFGSQS